MTVPVWKNEPDGHDYDAAESYLSLIADNNQVAAAVESLKAAPITQHPAKDIIRASGLPILPRANAHVRKNLTRISKGKKLSPVLLVHGEGDKPLVIADGYHRVCAVYYNDEDDTIDARVGTW